MAQSGFFRTHKWLFFFFFLLPSLLKRKKNVSDFIGHCFRDHTGNYSENLKSRAMATCLDLIGVPSKIPESLAPYF